MAARRWQKGERMEQSVEAMNAIPARMLEAWNRGDVTGFFADFAEDVLFAELEGTIYRSRAEAIAAHEELFATVLIGRSDGADVPSASLDREVPSRASRVQRVSP